MGRSSIVQLIAAHLDNFRRGETNLTQLWDAIETDLNRITHRCPCHDGDESKPLLLAPVQAK